MRKSSMGLNWQELVIKSLINRRRMEKLSPIAQRERRKIIPRPNKMARLYRAEMRVDFSVEIC